LRTLEQAKKADQWSLRSDFSNFSNFYWSIYGIVMIVCYLSDLCYFFGLNIIKYIYSYFLLILDLEMVHSHQSILSLNCWKSY